MSNEFNKFCEANEIHRELTTLYTSEQNGVVGCKNQTVVEIARSMLKNKDLSNTLWAEAVATTIYLLNLPPIKFFWKHTPFEAWNGFTPSVSHVKNFGSVCYVLVNLKVRQKLDHKSHKCTVIGYSLQSKAYRLFDPTSKKNLIRRDVLFDENSNWN